MGIIDRIKAVLDIRALVMEALGLIFIVFIGGWSWMIFTESNLQNFPTSFTDAPTDKTKIMTPKFLPTSPLLVVGLIHFFLMSTLTWAGAAISGGHFNPAITVGFMVTQNIHLIQGALYICAQLGGSVLGTLLFMFLVPSNFKAYAEENQIYNGLPMVDENIEFFGFLNQTVGAFALMYVFYAVLIEKKSENHIFGAAVGGIIGGTVMAFGPYDRNINTNKWGGNISGGALNPARAFGPLLFKLKFGQIWIFFAAPFVGAILAALVYKYFLHKKEVVDYDDEEIMITG